MMSDTRVQGMERDAPWRTAGRLSAVLPLVLLLMFVSEVVADGNVTLESITIFKTHEWFGRKPTVYFQCHEEGKVYLPDVLDKGFSYRFLDQESWQPLTTLHGTKCKRCGIYEKDTVKADDTFYEWELCPKAFSPVNGRYELFQEGELNATFICNECIPRSTEGDAVNVDEEEEEGEDKGVTTVLLILFFLLVVLIGLGVVAYSKWRQKQRAEQQARFMKMFEDDHDLDAELGLKDYM